jgi:hypothetical protein
MAVKRAVIAATVNQFGQPRGTAGSFAGRVNLARAPVDQLPPSLGGPFDAILTVNSRFWPAPTQQLDQLRRRLRLGGRIAIASQPRCPGATASTSREAAARSKPCSKTLATRRYRPQIASVRPHVLRLARSL